VIALLAQRLGSAAVTLFLVSLIIFAALHALPGGYADVFLGSHPTPEAKARIEEQFGLNAPLPAQYLSWLAAAVRGDFGVSLVTQKPVAEEFALRLPVTGGIALLATVLAVVIGLPAGILGGLAGPAGQSTARLAGSLAISVPDFVIGMILLFVVSRYGASSRGWFADAGLSAIFLPALSLSALGAGFVMTSARHATIGIRRGPWVMAAIARGLPMPVIALRHVVKNAAIPVVTVISIYFGYMLGGTAIVETTFTAPGIGHYVLQAVSLRDYPVIQAAALIAAAAFVVCNLAADLLYMALDPRVRAAGAE
jgi:peptide/nickel transport system permease protein